ncbi:MAG: hypothetical protein ACI4A3_13400 [Lachnospiraceae bacterium]
MKQVTGKQRGRRIVAWMLTLVVIMGGINLPGRTVKAAITATQPVTGDGTTNNPYQISSEAELLWLSEQVGNGTANMNAKLTADIVLTEEWERIGTNVCPYNDTFDGNGHTISNLTYQNTSGSSFAAAAYSGMFGYIAAGATVKNLGLINATVTTQYGYYAGMIAACNSGTIENCYSIGSTYIKGSNSGAAGGICGSNEAGGIVRYCYTSSETTVSAFVNGGIIGQNKGTVEYCYNTGTTSGSSYTGGIAGRNTNEGTEYGCIAYCYNSGKLDGGSLLKGGIVGKNVNEGNIVNKCYYDKDTVGENVSDVACGESEPANITNCQALATSVFSSGKVTYLLNDGKTDGSQLWYQTLETDTYPVLANTHGTVYQTSGSNYCDGTSSSDASYSNTSSGSSAVIHKSIEAVAAKAATCTEAGNQAHYKCTGCGKLYSDASGTQEITEASIQISALGHSLTAVPAKAATCEVDGNSAYWKCSRCNGIFSDAAGTNATTLDAVTIKSAGAHDYTKYTANADGTTHTVTCTQCGAVKTSTEAHSGGTATCTSPAVCSNCGASYGSATGHTYGQR